MTPTCIGAGMKHTNSGAGIKHMHALVLVQLTKWQWLWDYTLAFVPQRKTHAGMVQVCRGAWNTHTCRGAWITHPYRGVGMTQTCTFSRIMHTNLVVLE